MAEGIDDCAGCAARTTVLTGSTDTVDRRSFLVRSALLAAAAALAACAGDSPTQPDIAAGSTIRVSDYAALANVGGVALVTVSGAPLAIVRTSTSAFLALSRICPHQGSTVNLNGAGFLCPNHGARFDIDGNWVGGQRTSNLHSYPTSYDAASGVLTIG
jgi:nitrite reductase/ring-hydroxylating ferredoxin subunit